MIVYKEMNVMQNQYYEHDFDTLQIGWEILVHKYLYYVHNEAMIEDWQYDYLEKEWEQRTGKTAPVGFPKDRACCKLVASKGPTVAREFIAATMKERLEMINKLREKDHDQEG